MGLAEKESPLLMGRDMDDTINPDVVKQFESAHPGEKAFVYTDYFTTVCLLMPQASENEFLNSYECSVQDVVPRSAMKFNITDKDKNSIYRVVLFKTAKEGFAKWCREKRFVVRDFDYDEAKYRKRVSDRKDVQVKEDQQKQSVLASCSAAWSDVMICWVHVKAMRLCVECAMRYGATSKDVHIAALAMQAPAKAAQVRKVLANALGNQGSPAPFKDAKKENAIAADDEDMFPYVSLSMVPFAVGK